MQEYIIPWYIQVTKNVSADFEKEHFSVGFSVTFTLQIKKPQMCPTGTGYLTLS